MESRNNELTYAVLACLFAALISIGAYIAIPVPGTPIPIVLQNMFIMLAALILGPWWSLMAVGVYLVFGLVGMPVFSGGTGGLVKFIGPTGGYLVGYLPATILMGIIARKGRNTFIANLVACIAGTAVVYLFGVLRLKAVLNLETGKAMAAGLLPFLVGDSLKILLASALAPRLLQGLKTLTNEEDDA